MWGCKNWPSEAVYLYQQIMCSGMEPKSYPGHLAVVTERSYKLRLWLKRWGWKSFQGIGSYKQAISTETRMERPARLPGAEILKYCQLSFKHRPKLPAPSNMTLRSSLQETRGNRNSLLDLKKLFFSLVYLREKCSHSFWGSPKWHRVPIDPEGTVLSDMHKLPDLTLELP